MPVSVIASTHTQNISEWEPREKDLKTYFHFDRMISPGKIKAIANDANAVAMHSFFPLLLFKEEWTKFRKGKNVSKKVRPLRYAARIDAAIFACYRSKLSDLYESRLSSLGIEDIPVAYRRLKKSGGGHKNNIDIAHDVFSFIKNIGDCVVTIVDIKSYFESLDHENIRKKWCDLLGGSMPQDHISVFNAVTKYSVVDVDRVFERLDLYAKETAGNRKSRRMRKIDTLRSKGLRQLCTVKDFREIISGSR